MADGIKVPPFTILAVILALSLSFHNKCIDAKVTHYVVGDDRGWDASSDVVSWANRRNFLVGDSLWFTYSSAMENVVELGSKNEYDTCDLRNPIRMYNDGLSKVSLKGEGIRYFASGKTESCKRGLKIPVQVKPRSAEQKASMKPLAQSEMAALADPPLAPSPMPSGGARVINNGDMALLCAVLLLSLAM